MNTERKKRRGNLLIPLLLALPVLALLTAAVLRWGPELRDLINVAVKLVVIA